MSLRRKLPLLSALGVSMLAIAADQPFDIRPGEWEINIDIELGGGKQTMSRFSCVTAEDIQSARVLQMGSGEGRACTSQVTRQTAQVLEGVVHCGTGAAASRIQVRFMAGSPSRSTGTMKVTAADGSAQADFALAGQWLGAECADDGEDADFED
jgi:hypothetical protein